MLECCVVDVAANEAFLSVRWRSTVGSVFYTKVDMPRVFVYSSTFHGYESVSVQCSDKIGTTYMYPVILNQERHTDVIYSSDCDPVSMWYKSNKMGWMGGVELDPTALDVVHPKLILSKSERTDFPVVRMSVEIRVEKNMCSFIRVCTRAGKSAIWTKQINENTLVQFIKELDPDIVIGYGITEFDGVKTALDYVREQLPALSNALLYEGNNKRALVDMYSFFSDEMPLESTNIHALLAKHEMCYSDGLFKLYENYYIEEGLQQMARVLCSDLKTAMGGAVTKLESLIYAHNGALTRVVFPRDYVTNRPKGIGGLVLEPARGLHHNVAFFDIVGMYPSIIKTHHICYTTLKQDPLKHANAFHARVGVLETIVDVVLKERDDAAEKAIAYPSESCRYLRIRKNMKLLVNSIIGVTQHAGRLYQGMLNYATVQAGRDTLNRLVTFLHSNNYVVLYGDTDSMMVELGENSAEDTLVLIQQKLPRTIKMALQCVAESCMFFAKRQYAYVSNGKLCTKGLVTHSHCRLSNTILERCIKQLLNGESFVEDYVELFKRASMDDIVVYRKINLKGSGSINRQARENNKVKVGCFSDGLLPIVRRDGADHIATQSCAFEYAYQLQLLDKEISRLSGVEKRSDNKVHKYTNTTTHYYFGRTTASSHVGEY